MVDTCTVYPSNLIPSTFSSFTLAPTTAMPVNSLVPIRFDVSLSTAINRDDYFRVVFPVGTTFSFSSGIFGTANYVEPPTVSGQTVQIYHSSAVSASQTYSGNYTLVIQNFQAPPSTIPTQAIEFSVIRNNYPIMTGSATLTASAGTLTASVTPLVSRVWANTSYTFAIALTNPLSSSGLIKIALPG